MEYIVTDNNNTIICKGMFNACKSFLKQLDLDYKDFNFIIYNEDNYIYDDFNLINILNINIILTEGQYLILKESIDLEKQSIIFIEKELNYLIDSNIFSNESNIMIQDMIKKLNILKREHKEFLKEHYVFNIDRSTIYNLMEELYIRREKNLLPNKYIN